MQKSFSENAMDEQLVERLYGRHGEAVAVLGLDLRVRRWNASMAQLSKIAPAEAVGRRLVELVPGLAGSDAERRLETAVAGHHLASAPPFFGARDAARAEGLEWFTAPVCSDGTVIGTVLVARNVMAETGGGVDATGGFLRALAHDLREPIRMVSAFLDLLEPEAITLGGRAHRFFQHATSGAQRLGQIADGLSRLARAGDAGAQMSPVDLAGVLRVVQRDLAPACARSGASIEVGEMPTVVGDREQLRLLLRVVLDNALRFRGEQPARVRVTAEQRVGEQVVCVADNGVGFEQAYADRAFEPFERLHPREQFVGAGLGLTVARQIVLRHGGRIWLRSAPEQGTEVFVALPWFGSGQRSAP